MYLRTFLSRNSAEICPFDDNVFLHGHEKTMEVSVEVVLFETCVIK